MPLETVLLAKEFFATLFKGMRARPLKLVCLAGAATLAAATGATREAQVEAIAKVDESLKMKVLAAAEEWSESCNKRLGWVRGEGKRRTAGLTL